MTITKSSRAMKRAHILHANNPAFAWSDILRYGWYFERFTEWLKNGVIHFSYFKEDGSIREARGTLSTLLIPLDDAPKGTATAKPNYGVIAYYDIDKKGWRSFRITDFIGYVSGYQLNWLAPDKAREKKQSEITLDLLETKRERKR